MTRRPRHHRPPPRPRKEGADGDGHPPGTEARVPAKDKAKWNKTVQPPPELAARVEAIAEKNRNSWGATALTLIELGLAAGEGGEAGTVRLADLPGWLAAAVQEAARVKGLDPKAVVVDLLAKNVRDYLETARAQEKEMSGFLKLPKGQGN